VSRAICLLVVILAVAPLCSAATGWTLIGWNDLGMHCMDGDYSVYAILPPYNTIHAQLMDASGKLVRGAAGITVTYSPIPDPGGSVNTTSVWKSNFWQFVQKLFGAALAPDTGLTGNSLPGGAMKFDAGFNWFTADGIPVTPFDDAGNKNYYPMMRLTAKNASGAVLATTDIVLPVSDEMTCKSCHASGRDETQPAAGWAWNSYAERDYKLNILRLHDDRQGSSTAYRDALQTLNYAPAGLYATAAGGTPVLCAACHASNALGTKGQPGVSPLTQSLHAYHAHVTDDATGLTLDAAADRSACYNCHPGSATRCLRGVMGNSVAPDGTLAIQCQNCHGSMSTVGASGRQGWLDEPNCQACHTGSATVNSGQIRFTSAFLGSGQLRTPADSRFATLPGTPSGTYSLYRFSAGHGGLQCEACHGSTHAEFPSSHANDNVQSIARQGHVGVLAECGACHVTAPSTTTGGPHGMHPVGDTWVRRHGDAAEGNAASGCKACHGADYLGTALSQAWANRTFVTSFGTFNIWRGFQVNCYLCHSGPSGQERATTFRPAVVSNGTAATAVAAPVGILLTVTDPRGNPLALRVVSQPANGSVGISGTTATFTPNAEFEGTDSFTFAAWNGMLDSNLGSVALTVTAPVRPAFAADKVVNAASYAAGGVSPGEMVTIFGTGLGDNSACNFQVNSAMLISRTLCGTRVLFDGMPAALIYTSPTQVSVMAPYELAGRASTQVQVEFQGIQSLPAAVPVVASLPGIFTPDATGKGQAAILNQDGSPNSASNSAPKGSVVTVYATGEGLLDAAVVDGQLAGATQQGTVMLPVSVQIGGLDAEVQYKGTVPNMTAGFLQVKVKIPAAAPSGAVPVVLKIGGAVSQSGVTVAVQ
jgi:uncharacterized protein (TIGR03437 family)